MKHMFKSQQGYSAAQETTGTSVDARAGENYSNRKDANNSRDDIMQGQGPKQLQRPQQQLGLGER